MNGIHDMGGMQDMGPVQHAAREPVFHTQWERRVFALFNALDIGWPERRHQIESIPPADYLRMSYYERWLAAIGPLMIETGMVTREEIESGKVVGGTNSKWHVLSAAEAVTWIDPQPAAKGGPGVDARFQAGQRVRARNLNPIGHTRLPRYVRGKTGTVERDRGIFALQDIGADSPRQERQHVYTVHFAAKDLWGEQANPRDSVYVDMWEGYLEPA